jgi:hypothetical protein
MLHCGSRRTTHRLSPLLQSPKQNPKQPDQLYANLLAGKSGVTEISTFDASEFSTRFAGEVKDLETDGYIAKKMERRLDKCIKCVAWPGWGWGAWGGGDGEALCDELASGV